MNQSLYQFKATRFVRNSLWRQWWHMLSEVLEVGWALLRGDLQWAARETIDVRQSAETMNRIQSGLGADIEMAMETVVKGCEERGYYRSK